MGRHDVAVAVRVLDRGHAHATTMGLTVFAEFRALAIAVLSRDQERLRLFADIERDDVVVVLERDALDARRRAAHPTHLVRQELDADAVRREHDHELARLHEADLDEFVALLDVDRANARLVDVLVVAEKRLLDRAELRREEHVDVALEGADRQQTQDLLALLQVEEVDERTPEARTRGLGNLVRATHEETPRIGEEHELVMRLRDEDESEEVLFLHLRALHAVAAATLLLVLGERHALDVATVRQRDDTGFVGDEVLDRNLVRIRHDLRATLRVFLLTVLRLDLLEVGADDRVDLLRVGQDRLVLGNRRNELGEFFRERLTRETDELVETHLEDRVDLQVGELEALLEARLRLVARLRRADDVDDLVEIVDREEESVDDVLARQRLLEIESRAAGDHLETVIRIALEVILEVEHLRTAADDREQNRAERRLQLRVLVEVVEDDLADRVTLEVDDDADVVLDQLAALRESRGVLALLLRVLGVATGQVADVADALDHLVLHELGHVTDHLRLVDRVRNLGDDDLFAPVLADDDLGLAADRHLAAPELVHRVDTVVSAHHRARREVRTLHELHEVIDRALLAVLHVVADAVAEFAEIVRRDVRRHAHGNARGTVQQEVRQLRREDRRLLQRLVEVRHHIDRVLLEIAQELLGRLLHAHFRVTHRRRRIAVNRAEVAVTIDKRQAEREVLRQTDDRIVDGRVAVRVVLADHFTDDAGGLHVLAAVRVAEFVHREETAAVYRLEAVAHIRQRTTYDDAHRIVNVVTRHRIFDVDIFQRGRSSNILDHTRVFYLFFAHSVYYSISRARAHEENARKWCFLTDKGLIARTCSRLTD